MSVREMLPLLNGTKEQKRQLFDQLLERAVQGVITDDELPILETLKKDLIVETQVVQMSASLQGNAGVLS